MLKDGYASHLTMLQNPNTGSRQALGNARLILKKTNFSIWHNQLSINLNNQLLSQNSRDSAELLGESLNHSMSNQLTNTNSEKTPLNKLYSLQNRTKNQLK